MLTKDCVEAAYCFFHQKLRIYSKSTDRVQREAIEYAISSYVEGMNTELYSLIAEGKDGYLIDYTSFTEDLTSAVERLERMLE